MVERREECGSGVGRGKVIAGAGGVTRQSVAGSRSSEAEVGLRLAGCWKWLHSAGNTCVLKEQGQKVINLSPFSRRE